MPRFKLTRGRPTNHLRVHHAGISAAVFAVMMVTIVAPSTADASNTVEGTLEVFVRDYFPSEDDGAAGHDRSHNQVGASAQDGDQRQGYAEYDYRLQRDDGSEVILRGEDALAGHTTGERVAVQGRVVSAAGAEGPDRMAVRSVERLEGADHAGARQGRAADLDSGGIEKRRVLGIVVDFADSETDVSLGDARNIIRRAGDSADAIFRIGSGGAPDGGGQLGFFPPSSGPDVFHADLDINSGGCDHPRWANKADEAARAAGIDFSNHQHTVYFLPENPGCGWGGLGSFGCSGGCRVWVFGDTPQTYRATAHELGHNLGLGHTRRFRGEGKEPREYGEATLMGYTYGIINPPHREVLGWYEDHPDSIHHVENGQETVTITAISADYDDSHPHAIKVPVAGGDSAYYAYIADENPYANTAGSLGRASVIITRMDAGSSITTEYAELGLIIPQLVDGDSYHDEEHGIRFTLEEHSMNPGEATLRVENGDDLVAEDIEWTMAPGQTHEGTLEASEPNGTEPSFVKESSAGQGQVRVNSDGTFSYTANRDAEGSDTFTFQASAEGQSDDGAAEVTFNQTPQVETMELSVTLGDSVKGTLPVSDAESDIADIAITVTSSPNKGMLDGPRDDGSFTYTADGNSPGTDTFRYTAGDAYSESTPAEVRVSIQDDDSGGSDSGSSDEGSSGIGALSAPWLLMLGLAGLLAAARQRLPARG